MASQPVSRAKSFRDSLRRRWTAVSATTSGDILATAVAIGGVMLIFLACAFCIIGLLHAVGLLFSRIG